MHTEDLRGSDYEDVYALARRRRHLRSIQSDHFEGEEGGLEAGSEGMLSGLTRTILDRS